MHARMVSLALAALALVGCGPRLDLYKAERLMVKGKWADADTLLQKVASSHVGSKWAQKALMLAGCAQFKQARLDDAARTLERAREALPGGEWADDAEYYLARVRYRQGDLPGAREGFRRVLTAYGDDPKRSNCKALAMEELEFLDKKGLQPRG